MARVQLQAHFVLSQIRNARSFAEQSAALRSLKNEVVGHVQKKERCIECGVLEPIVEILARDRSSARLDGKDGRTRRDSRHALSEEEAVRSEALQLLASLMNGGPAFLAPLHSAGVLPAILANLDPLENPPQVVTATLRILHHMTEASTWLLPPSPIDTCMIADAIFVPEHLGSIFNILTPASASSLTSQTQISLAANLIARLCRDERHQVVLASSGILDALATRLASFVVAKGQVVPGAESLAQSEGLADAIPGPAPRGANMALVLEAISVIVADSRLRACIFLYSPSMMAVFPHVDFAPPARDAKAAWNSLEMAALSNLQPQRLGPMDYFLPVVPAHQSKTLSSAASVFPPLGTSRSRDSLSWSGRSSTNKLESGLSSWNSSRSEPFNPGAAGDAETEEPESPLIPWLIDLVRTSHGMERLMAASVLTSMYKAGFANRSRESAMGFLVVPLLVQMLSSLEGSSALDDSATVSAETATNWAIMEHAPTVLARLITDSEFLQKAAFECNAVKVFSKLLKDACEPLPPTSTSRQPWSPTPQAEKKNPDREIGLPTCRLGPRGQSPLHAHRIRMRESSLKAVTALMAFKDDYRKALVEQDIVPYIVESLSRTPSRPKSGQERERPQPSSEGESLEPEGDSEYGTNPVSVIISACHAVRMLSRSISILRTSLEDHGAAMPLFRLMRHPDLEVQIVATGAICNLVTEVAPMRERLTEAGIMKVLCDHAHSLNAALRLNAVWALKHFIHIVSVDMKKECLEELESGWLVQLVCDDTEDEALFARTRGDKFAAPHSAAVDDMDGDIEMDQEDEESKLWALYRSSTPRSTVDRSSAARLRRAEAKIAELRERELNPVRTARSDDLAIQEQGLAFIRNFIGPAATSDLTEMIDHLFREVGQDRLFQILTAKLRAKVLRPFSRRLTGAASGSGSGSGNGDAASASASASARVLYPQAQIVEAVVFILVHIAASVPRHRQLVIAQTDLLRQLGSHFGCQNKNVRVALCHLISNLTWMDDPADAQASAHRAIELKRLGLLGKLESLEQEDGELDVRERAKAAIWQMKQGNY